MRILLVSQYFYPESFRGNDIAFELSRRGYDVTVLTGIPNYPSGKFAKGYGYFSRRRENINGVKVIRTFLLPRRNSQGINLMLNYFSWLFSSSICALFLGLFKKYDRIIVQQLSPVTVGVPALIVSKLNNAPIYFWVLDLWPESLLSGGGTKSKSVISFFEKLVTYLYKNSYKILVSSNGFRKSIIEKGDFGHKIMYFPNWAENHISTGGNQFETPSLPEGFKIMFAGNLGEAQDMDTILEAALHLKESSSIQFVFVGDGRKMDFMKEYVERHQLNNVYLLGRYPIETMPAFFSQADLMLVTLKDDPIMNLTVPAKVQAYMSVGKPILAMLNGEGNALISLADCGFTVPASDSKELAEKIIQISQMDKNELSQKGFNGKKYFDENFNLNLCIDNLENIIK